MKIQRFGIEAIAVVLAILAASTAGATPSDRPPRAPLGDRSLNEFSDISDGRSSLQSHAVLHNFRLVGHSRLGGDIDFGDVWARGHHAYVGTRCGDDLSGGGGVRVVDLSDPSSPQVVGRLHNPRYSRAEDVVVRRVSTPWFTGRLAAVGVQVCFGSGHEEETRTGMRFFDVSHPAHPDLLGTFELPLGAIGCHEIDLISRRQGRVLAGCARNLIDHFNTEGEKAVHIIDVTNPRSPRKVSNFSLEVAPDGGFGCLPFNFAHSIRFTNHGRDAYVSYWDAGTVHLDLSDPATPTIVGTTKITPPDEDGDNHSMTLANRRRWLIINPEDGSPADCGPDFGGFGEAYVYRNRNPENPRYIGSFATDNTLSSRSDGLFDVHNTEVLTGRQFASSWYSDGIVWWTMSKRGTSHQKGQFVPPPSRAIGIPLVWGVYNFHLRNLVLASDIGSGLWIVRPKGLGDF
jgi:hypothetical protein